MTKLETAAAFTDGDERSQADPRDGMIVIEREAAKPKLKIVRSLPGKRTSPGKCRRKAA